MDADVPQCAAFCGLNQPALPYKKGRPCVVLFNAGRNEADLITTLNHLNQRGRQDGGLVANETAVDWPKWQDH